jgi:hypothetical protein
MVVDFPHHYVLCHARFRGPGWPERLLFASDYRQDFTGVNTDTGKGCGN